MKLSALLAVLILFLSSTCGFAAIIDSSYAPDGDGVFLMPNGPVTAYQESGEYEYDLDVAGILRYVSGEGTVGHLVGWCDTDTPDDPTINAYNVITNEDPFAWTGMTVNVSIAGLSGPLPSAPTLALLAGLTPADWTQSVVQSPTWNGSAYVATIQYTGGTPVAYGEDLGFNYKVSFSGSTHYTFIQEMAPVPEPGTLVLLACGAIGLFVARRRLAR
jgi:hypothetical protein